MSQPLLEVKNLRVRFPVHGGVLQRKVAEVKAVDGVSFTIERGETLGLVGESGCGKTTVGRALINILKHVSPGVELDGEVIYVDKNGTRTDLLHLSKRDMIAFRSKIQMIFQDPYSSLNARLSVKQIIAEPLEIHMPEMSKQQVDEKVMWLLERVGLQPEYAGRYPHEFSGGQRQRICIARALALKPKLLICDESVSALDVSVQAQVLNLLVDLRDEFKLTYIFISHDLSVVKFISDRIAVMNAGKIVEMDTSNELYDAPKDDYTRRLINAIPTGTLDAIRARTKERPLA